jgi:(R,R)-butanediol dehydrogenase/meso-butanediol dehydrogenase/diacetyl reductase
MAMRAVRFHGIGKLSVEEIAPPAAPGAGEVHLKVLAAGICGSDLHNFKTGQWIAHLPVTPGHEFTAEVLAVGDAVAGLAPGDRVIADSRAPCGACEQCQMGRPNLCVKLGYVGEVCDGGFAEEVVLPARGLLKVDASIPPQVAALSEPLAVALHAIKRASLRKANRCWWRARGRSAVWPACCSGISVSGRCCSRSAKWRGARWCKR